MKALTFWIHTYTQLIIKNEKTAHFASDTHLITDPLS